MKNILTGNESNSKQKDQIHQIIQHPEHNQGNNNRNAQRENQNQQDNTKHNMQKKIWKSISRKIVGGDDEP